MLLPITSALVYKSGGIEIYTPVKNIYIDEIIKDMFIRRTYLPSYKMLNPFFSKSAMVESRIRNTKKVIRTAIAQKDVQRICKNLDIDYLLKMSESYKKVILQCLN